MDVVEPATGEVWTRVPDSDERDVDAAVGAASRGVSRVEGDGGGGARRVLFKLADLIDANLERLAIAESRDTGKLMCWAWSVDIPRSASNFRYFARG